VSSSKAELALPALENGQLAFLVRTGRHERLWSCADDLAQLSTWVCA
jgi:hypothetical protein